jgi:glutathione S-transferase
VQKVVLACEELKLPHQRLDAGGVFGKVKEPAYLAMNPNGLLPVLIGRELLAKTA